MPTYYISPAPAGSDSNPGTIGSPFLTLVKAETVVAPGDTVLIADGTYAGMTTSISGSDASNRIIYRAINAGMVALSSVITSLHSFRTYDGFIFNNVGDRSFDVVGASNSFLNITININYGTGYGIKIGIDANTGGEGSNNNLIDNLRIVSTYVGAQTVHGVLFGGGASGNVLRNSYISNTYYGLVDKVCSSTRAYNNVFNGTASGLYLAIYSKGSTDSIYVHNTLRMPNGGYGVIMAPSDGGSPQSTNALILNNIFIKGSADACIYNAGSGSFVSDYNVFQFSGALVYAGAGPTIYSTLAAWQATGHDANSIVATPLFTNGSATLTELDDYQPTSSSPVINKGTTSIRTLDAGGNSAVSEPDIGPWEFLPVGAVYVIATDGNDAGAGTLADPWEHIEMINSIDLQPGDVVNIRAGTYDSYAPLFASSFYSTQINGKNGSPSAHIIIQAYPPDFVAGGRVVYNLLNETRTSGGIGISTLDSSYIDFFGISVVGPAQEVGGGTGTYAAAWWFSSNTSNTNVTANNCEGSLSMTGFRLDNVNNATYNDCDAHDIDDPYTGAPTGPHNNSDGFSRTNALNTATGTVYNRCRAWYCADDGWDCFGTDGTITYNHCWSFYNGYDSSLTHLGDGNGFKMGGTGSGPGLSRFAHFCVAFGNYANGFDQNLGTFIAEFYNNSAINNGANDWKYGYNQPIPHVFRNNLSIGNNAIDGITSDADDWGANDHNSWNGAVTIDTSDFVSMDGSQLLNARQANGNLPIITAFHLVEGSDLIDAGVDVGFAFNGLAPDMGAFEFGEALPPPEDGRVASLSIAFTPCDVDPIDGYRIYYRVVGDDEWIDAGLFPSSPAIVTGLSYPSGTVFEAEGFNPEDCNDSGGGGGGCTCRFAVAGEDDFGQQERYFSFDDLDYWNFTFDIAGVATQHQFIVKGDEGVVNDAISSFTLTTSGLNETLTNLAGTIFSRLLHTQGDFQAYIQDGANVSTIEAVPGQAGLSAQDGTYVGGSFQVHPTYFVFGSGIANNGVPIFINDSHPDLANDDISPPYPGTPAVGVKLYSKPEGILTSRLHYVGGAGNNQVFSDGSGFIALSVNGNFADSNGNITI